MPDSRRIRMVLKQSFKLKPEATEHGIVDGDYTEDFVQEGTTLSTTDDSCMKISAPVPVTKAWVEDGILYMEAETIVGVNLNDV